MEQLFTARAENLSGFFRDGWQTVSKFLSAGHLLNMHSHLDPLPLLRDLIQIPSVNPTGHPGTDQTEELGMATYLRERLQSMGAKTRLQEVAPGRPNVIGLFRPRGGVRRRVLLAPHTDTVSVAGMRIDPFKPQVKQGRVYGRGATDTKGPMAAMLTAVAAFTASPHWPECGLEITFAGLMGEEAGNEGAKAWARVCPDYDLVIAGEPTEMQAVHAHHGAVWLELEISGKPMHASLADPSDNALYRMTPVLEFFEKKLPRLLQEYRHPLLGLPKATLTMMEAGSKVNITPHSAIVRADCRVVPGLRGATLAYLLRRHLGSNVHVRIMGESQPLATDPHHPLVEVVADATRGTTTAPWFCDASIFAARGMTAIALGPGSIRQAHTADEWISVRALREGAEGFLRVLDALATTP